MTKNRYPKLNLPAARLRATKRDGCNFVWDAPRGCWVVLTPEEWVRRHVVGWLSFTLGIEAVNIIQEFPISLGGACQRADIVIRGREGEVVMLVECKAADVVIDSTVLDQAVRYNSVVGARYIMLTNGLYHYFYEMKNGKEYVRLDAVPDIKLS